MPTAPITIKTGFPSSIETDLVRQICRARKSTAIHISPFARFGKSGARLLLSYFAKRPRGLPYLIKISKDTQSEYRAIRKMETWVRECKLARPARVFRASGWGALLFEHMGSDRADEAAVRPVSFRQLLFHPDGVDAEELPKGFDRSINEDSLRKCLAEVFEHLHGAHEGSRRQWVTIETHYAPYFRRGQSEARILGVLGRDGEKKSLSFLGKDIVNPVVYRRGLPKERQVHVGHVHGDLHPDNVIVDVRFNPHLIDFAWAEHRRDVLVDFVLLENSIRFWHFPSGANLEEQGIVDDILLDEDGFKKLTTLTFSSATLAGLYRRLAALVEEIRRGARVVLGRDFSMNQYLFTQFVVLYGLLKYESYSPHVTTRALGMIGQRLVSKK